MVGFAERRRFCEASWLREELQHRGHHEVPGQYHQQGEGTTTSLKGQNKATPAGEKVS